LFAGLKTETEEEIMIAEICKQYGWTYEEYQNTPLWFIDTIKIRNSAEAYFNEKEMRKLKRQTQFRKH